MQHLLYHCLPMIKLFILYEVLNHLPFEEDGSQRDGEAALQGRGSGIRRFVGQLCGERRHVRERLTASEWKGGCSFCPGTVRGGCQWLG